jgi:hypothetical protein
MNQIPRAILILLGLALVALLVYGVGVSIYQDMKAAVYEDGKEHCEQLDIKMKDGSHSIFLLGDGFESISYKLEGDMVTVWRSRTDTDLAGYKGDRKSSYTNLREGVSRVLCVNRGTPREGVTPASYCAEQGKDGFVVIETRCLRALAAGVCDGEEMCALFPKARRVPGLDSSTDVRCAGDAPDVGTRSGDASEFGTTDCEYIGD